ncbi:MAG: two-component system sensor kinase FixL [Sulfurimonas sp.]|jgi:two-component system sensor kinase FixL|uniref:PAS domain S-box protein n=1 Tax=Sulfurimonas sp. TaxID=2022749 RepID=UPI0039E60FD7
MLNETYKEIFERSQDGFLILRENIILDCNDAFVVMFAYDSKEELLGLTPWAISPEFQPDGSSSYEKSLHSMEKVLEEGFHRFEWVHTQKDKNEVDFEVTLTSITYHDKPAIFATLRDISDRKALQLANQKLTTRLALAFTGNNDGIWDWNLEDNSIYFSPSWKEMLGYTNDELESSFEVWQNLVHPQDLQNALDDTLNYFERKADSYENYHRLKHKDGSWVWILARGKAKFDETGKATRFIGTHTNITKEKNLEEELKNVNSSLENIVHEKTGELQKSNNYLETIFNTVKDGIAIMDLESNFVLLNDAYEKMTGYKKKELYKKSCLDLTDLSMLNEYKSVLHKVIEYGYYMDYEKIYILADNTQIWIRMDIVLMPDKRQILALVRDLSVEKKLEKEKEFHHQQMLQQSRLAQMGEMISMIAHQWRQPLGAISTTAANLSLKLEIDTFDLETKKSKEECSTYFLQRLANIESYIESLTNTIDDFRNFYKPNKERVFIKLDTILARSLNIIKSSLTNDGIEILYYSNDSQEIEMYDNEMMQVLLNILKNAQDNFLEKDVKYPKIIINVEDKKISITDNGKGIHEDIIGRIFDPYFSTKDEKNGTGLGLYMSKMIVEDHHHGRLLVANIENGTCFRIDLN